MAAGRQLVAAVARGPPGEQAAECRGGGVPASWRRRAAAAPRTHLLRGVGPMAVARLHRRCRSRRLRRRRWGDHKVAPFISRPPHPPPTSAVCGRRSPSRRVASTRPVPGPPQSAGAAPTTRRCGTPFVRALLSFLAVSCFLFLCSCRYRVVHTCRHSPWHPRHTHTASRMSADAHHPARPATHRCGPLWPPHPRQAQPPHLLSSDLPLSR